MDKTEICPHCGNYVVGRPNYSVGQNLVRNATKHGINWGLKVLITLGCAFFGGVLGVGIGLIPGFILGIIIASFFGNSVDKDVNTISDAIYSSTAYTFSCPKCGNYWEHILGNNTDTESDELLLNRKRIKAEKLKGDASGNLTVGVIFALCCVGCVWYWNTHSFQDSLWVGILLLIFGFGSLLSLIACLVQFSLYFSKKSKCNEIERMSLNDFRFSKYRYEE